MAARLETIAQSHLNADRITRCKVQFRYRFGLVAQLRLRIKLGFIPRGVKNIFNNDLQLVTAQRVRGIHVEQRMPLSRYTAVLVGGAVANMAIAQRAFEAASVSSRKASGRG